MSKSPKSRNRDEEVANALKHGDTYEIIVRFRRSLSDDLGVLERSDTQSPLAEALTKQLVRELQIAYDHPDTALAGSFEVIAGPNLRLE